MYKEILDYQEKDMEISKLLKDERVESSKKIINNSIMTFNKIIRHTKTHPKLHVRTAQSIRDKHKQNKNHQKRQRTQNDYHLQFYKIAEHCKEYQPRPKTKYIKCKFQR